MICGILRNEVGGIWTSGPEFQDLRRDTHSWASLDAWITGGANLAGKTQPVRVTAAYLSGGLLEILAVAPVAGRLISQTDDVPGAQVVADISYGTWQSVFAGDPSVVGRETYLDGLKCNIIGVMPKGFQFPPGEQEPAQIWTALRLDPANPGNRGGHNYYLLGRLLPGVTGGQAQGELASLVQSYGEKRVPKTHSFRPKTHTIISFPLQADEISMDWRVLLFTLGTSLLTGVLFGLAPLAPLLLSGISETLKDTAGSTTAAAGAQIFRRILVAGELAMALVLLIGCGLMLRAFWKLQEVHTGLHAENIVTMRVSLPSGAYTDNAKITDFWTRLDARLTNLPGVPSAALVSGLAPIRPPNMNDTDIEGFVQTEGGPIPNVDFYQAVSKDYLATMGIRLMDGRLFDGRDVQGAPDAVIINKTMAMTFWPHQSPIGRRIRPGGSKDWCTIIGIVDDVKNAGLDRPAGTELYLPYRQPAGAGNTDMYIVMRTSAGDPRSLAGVVREQLNEIDPSLPLADIRMMEDVLTRAQARPRFLTLLLSLFSGVALAIATVGIYGVVSYSVARRTKEFGLRMVLGAQGGDVLGLVMKQGGGMSWIGVASGLVLAFVFTRLMASLLFGVTATDLPTYACVTIILFGVAFSACYIPARRATRVDPIQTLRYE